MAFIALLHLDNNFPRISFKRILFLRFGTLSFITRYINVVILPTLVRHHDVFLLDLAHQGTPLLAVSEVLLVLVDEPGVVFTAHQDDRGVGAEPPDLLVPHAPKQHVVGTEQHAWTEPQYPIQIHLPSVCPL